MRPIDRHGRSLLGAALTLVGFASVAAPTLRRPKPGQASFELAQGVILELSASPTVYFPDPTSGIDAVDLRTGHERWHTRAALLPLVAHDTRLLAFATRFPDDTGAKLVLLDTDSGMVVAARPTLEIPGWGPLTYVGGQGLEAWFALSAVSKGQRDFLVWHYRKQYVVGGATPPRPLHPRAPAERDPEDSGVVEVNLARAAVVPTAEAVSDRPVRATRDRSGSSEWGPIEVDGVSATLVRVVGTTATKLLLRRTRAGKPLPDVLISASPSNDCSFFASLDWHHVLSACQVAGRRDPFMYAVTVYAARTGRRVGRIALGTSPVSFVVWNNRLVYFFPWHVGVVDLGSGEKVFDRPTRDVSYSAPPRG